MDLSVIILTWNSERYVESCLRAMFSSLAATSYSYEILIVDNGSTDTTTSLIRQIESHVSVKIDLISLPTNIGTTKSRNIALTRAVGKYICIMDSDVEITPETFTRLITLLKDNPGIGLAAPRIPYPNGNWQKSWDRFPTLQHKINRFFNLKKMEPRDAELYQSSTINRDVDYAISAFWLFSRNLLTTVGLLDERIFYSPEDVDYCMRIWKSGYRIMYVPSARVTHHTQEISRGWRLSRSKFSHLKGLAYLFAKHGYLFRSPCLRPLHSSSLRVIR